VVQKNIYGFTHACYFRYEYRTKLPRTNR